MEADGNGSAMAAYQERIVGYADILGWSSATKNGEIKTLVETLKSIEDYANNFSPLVKEALEKSQGVPERLVREHDGIEFSFFSDCFTVSAPASSGQVVFMILAFASHELLRKGFLLRGGVTVGPLYHKQQILFGPALVEAVEIENSDAVVSRFLCSRQLIQFLDLTDYKSKVVLLDCCDSWIVNIAMGNSLARDELMKLIKVWLDKNETAEVERVVHKWRYLQWMLPVMYECSDTEK
jgi:hypothetical protein